MPLCLSPNALPLLAALTKVRRCHRPVHAWACVCGYRQAATHTHSCHTPPPTQPTRHTPADPMVKPIDQYVFAARVSVLLRGLGKVPWPAGCPLLQNDVAILTCVVSSRAPVNHRQKGFGPQPRHVRPVEGRGGGIFEAPRRNLLKHGLHHCAGGGWVGGGPILTCHFVGSTDSRATHFTNQLFSMS